MLTLYFHGLRAIAVAACFIAVAPGPVRAETVQELQAGVWEGKGIQGNGDQWAIRLELQPSGDGRATYPSLDCGGALRFRAVEGQVVHYSERIEFGQNHCTPKGEVFLSLGPDQVMIYQYSRQGTSAITSEGRLVRAKGASATGQATASETATKPAAKPLDYRPFMAEGQRFIGQVQSEPKYVGGPRRTYDADIEFVGDAPLMRLRIGGERNSSRCMGALFMTRLLSDREAEFHFQHMTGRGDIIIDCPKEAELRLSKVAGGIGLSWAPRENIPVAGILGDQTAAIEAEQKAKRDAARNAQPCTHADWDGVQVNIADSLACDEGRAIKLFRKGAELKLVVSSVSFAQGQLIATANVPSLAGKREAQVVCVFAEDSEALFSTGDTIKATGRLSEYANGRLVLDCEVSG